MASREVLLLLGDRNFFDRASEGYRIISTFPPRMVVVEVTELDELRRDPDVRLIVEDTAPNEIFGELTEGEKMFMNGWLARQSPPKKKRVGNHLPWDAPGFIPPDPPPDSE